MRFEVGSERLPWDWSDLAVGFAVSGASSFVQDDADDFRRPVAGLFECGASQDFPAQLLVRAGCPSFIAKVKEDVGGWFSSPLDDLANFVWRPRRGLEQRMVPWPPRSIVCQRKSSIRISSRFSDGARAKRVAYDFLDRESVRSGENKARRPLLKK